MARRTRERRGSLRDLEGVVADVHDESEVSPEGLDVAAQGVDLGLVQITALDPGDPVLADFQFGGEFDLGEVELFTQFPQSPGSGL